jgi:hypothetical protein
VVIPTGNPEEHYVASSLGLGGFPAIPAESPSPVITERGALAFRKP